MPTDVQITTNVIVMVAGFVLAGLFKYIPNFRVTFAAMSSEAKSSIMAVCLAGVVAVIILVSCTGLWGLIACTQVGIVQVIWYLGLALITNQGGNSILPEPADVKVAKADRNLLQKAVAIVAKDSAGGGDPNSPS